MKAYMGMDAQNHVRTSIEAKLAHGDSCKRGDAVLTRSIDGINITAGKTQFPLELLLWFSVDSVDVHPSGAQFKCWFHYLGNR